MPDIRFKDIQLSQSDSIIKIN